MLVFYNQQRSGYEEIASYSPQYYRNIKEMDAVFRLAGWLTDLMAQDMEDMVAFQFLKYMNDEVLTRYEGFLGIKKEPNRTLKNRKDYINALLIGSGKISANKIVEIVNKFSWCACDEIVLSGSELHISIVFQEDVSNVRKVIYNLLRQKLPAHIGMDIAFDNSITGTMYFGSTIQEVDIVELRQR